MMALLYVFLIVGGLLNGSVAAKDRSMEDLKINVVEVSRSGSITVEITNASGVPIRVWQESNSWGAARWRVTLIRKAKLETFFQNPDQDFTKNYPLFNPIAVGAHSVQKLDLNGGNWCGLGRCTLYGERRSGIDEIHFEAGDVIVVAYDVPLTVEARNLRVWYGVSSALATVQ